MKKSRKFLMILGIVLSLAVATGTTLAYLTDTDSDVNVMTLGNVDITQLENGEAENGFENGQPLYPAYYEDEIDWKTNEGVVDKEVTVENTGKSDAYVRTWFAFEAGEMSYEDFQKYILLNIKESDEWTWEWDENTAYTIKNENGEESKYYIAVATRGEALPAGATTGASLLDVAMSKDADNEVVEAMGEYYTVLVLTQAVQVNGFEEMGATAALAEAFGDVDVENDAIGVNHPWTEGFEQNYPVTADTWDGTADTSWYNDTDTEFVLTTAEQLAGFAELANDGNNFSGKTIELESDMDLGRKTWIPIARFSGTLNGNEHTISNLYIDSTAGHGGFIDVMEWATVEDLTLADIEADVGNYRFGVLARSINQSNIDNVTVKDVRVTTTASEAFVAGLFCHGTVNSNMEVNNCTVENFTVNAENGAMMIGGITDFVQKNGTEAEGTNIFENLTVKNFTVIANDTDGYCNIGGLVGQTQSVWQNPRFNNCSVSGLDVTATGTVNVGGFMCAPGSWTYAENCTVEGKIDASGVTSDEYYAGGFFGDYGWGDNVGKGDHKVTSCSADVDIITKYASAGGFVGSGTNSEGRNKNITLTNCEAKGTITLADGGAANIGGFAGQTDRGIYINCSAAQDPFIGKVLDGYTLTNDGAGKLTVIKN